MDINADTHRRWKADWIWPEGDARDKNAYCYFRKTFRLIGAEPAQLHISADSRYELFVNGTFVAWGGHASQPFRQYYDTHDVTDLLQHRENVIAVIVNHTGTLPDTRGGLLLELETESGESLGTNDTWRAQPAAAWHAHTQESRTNRDVPFQTFFDARQEPEHWRTKDFDDSDWPFAATSADVAARCPPSASPGATLIARDTAFIADTPALPERIECLEENLDLINPSQSHDLAPGLSMIGKPIQCCRAAGVESLVSGKGASTFHSSSEHLRTPASDGAYAPAVVLDFGRILTARLTLDMIGPAGSMIEIGYVERLIDGRFDIAMECAFAERVTLKDGEQTFTTFGGRSFRYAKLRFRSCPDGIVLKRVQAMITTSPHRKP